MSRLIRQCSHALFVPRAPGTDVGVKGGHGEHSKSVEGALGWPGDLGENPLARMTTFRAAGLGQMFTFGLGSSPLCREAM